MTKRNPGRPAQRATDVDNNSREDLIEAAKHCFTRLSYSKVTTRLLAKTAKVNAGLIGYYFINKEGLYKAMISDMVDAMNDSLVKMNRSESISSIEPILRGHTMLMAKYPQFPQLLIKELMGEGLCFNFITDSVDRLLNPVFFGVMKQLQNKGKLRSDVDLVLLRVTMVSCMLMPWLTRKAAKEIDGAEFDNEMLEKLISHNTQILEHGCFVPEPPKVTESHQGQSHLKDQ
ncbi:MAG: TetR/AcrR family transcriptional regulator [Algicola sp.]|nr:TetR/AcrR family transcriptional regulator [Algicola sp.]